jgi:hypothetical protein
VISEELDQNGDLLTQSRHLAIDPEDIQQLLDMGGLECFHQGVMRDRY